MVNAQPAVGVFAVVYAAGAAASAARRSAGSPAAAASPESPNYFLINIAPEQVTPLKGFPCRSITLSLESFYPIVRARLTRINGQPTEGNKDESLNRELNLTRQEKRLTITFRITRQAPAAGKWGGFDGGRVMATRLNVKLGTRDLHRRYGDFTAKVPPACVKVDWESLRPNFFFIFPPGRGRTAAGVG